MRRDLYEEYDEYKLLKLILKKLKEKRQINESFNISQYTNKFIPINLVNIFGDNIKFKILLYLFYYNYIILYYKYNTMSTN